MTPAIPILALTREYCVIKKPAGLTSEEGAQSLIPLLQQALAERGENTALFPVHRLDKPTGGVMVYARTKESAAYFSRLAADNGLHKLYLAKISGNLTPPDGEMHDLLFHDRTKNKTFAVKRMRKGVKEAALLYRTLEQTDGDSLLAIRLLTGRTHQIRAQLATRGFSLLGDRRYGGKSHSRLCLWAQGLAFREKDGTEVCFCAPAPFAPAYDQPLFSLFPNRTEE